MFKWWQLTKLPADFTWSGSDFHRVGPASEKKTGSDICVYIGNEKMIELDDRRWLGFLARLRKYAGCRDECAWLNRWNKRVHMLTVYTAIRYLRESQLRYLKETRRLSNYYLQTKNIVNTLKLCDILETYMGLQWKGELPYACRLQLRRAVTIILATGKYTYQG